MARWSVIAYLGCVLLGFLAGLFVFKVKARWCRECGATLSCVECRQRRRARAATS